jgi:hypothetical protein
MDLLQSKNFSLVCTVINGLMAIHGFINGDWGWGLICVGFAAFCYNNYRNAKGQ